MAQIIWTEPAIEDLDSVAGFIALDKPGAAKRLVRRVLARVEQLALFPQSGGKPHDLIGTPYRQLVVLPLRIFYRESGGKVFIIHVMRGERQFRLGDVSARER
jgi:toxin ParE1/3/4